MRRNPLFNSLLQSFCLAVLLLSWTVVKARAQEKPRLKDFGSSLKKNSGKKGTEPQSGKPSDEADDVVRVQTDLVVCDVMVVNKEGNAIPGLGRGDFVVHEEGVPQEIGSFSLGDDARIPRSIVLILDYSGSQAPFIKTSVEAAKVLVDKLGPKDRMALVTDDVKLLVDFTQDKARLKQELESLKKKAISGTFGKSLQYSSLLATLREMFNQEDLRPIVIFQTDGDQLYFLRGFSYKDVTVAAEKSRATIYSIIPGPSLLGLSPEARLEKARPFVKELTGFDDRDHVLVIAGKYARWQFAIAELAKLSGGWPDFIEKPEQADEVYERIFTDINHRYVIGYYPTNKTRDGKRRNIKIEVRGHPEYIVWGRKTYFAPEE